MWIMVYAKAAKISKSQHQLPRSLNARRLRTNLPQG